jgi:hypothetical protein
MKVEIKNDNIEFDTDEFTNSEIVYIRWNNVSIKCSNKADILPAATDGDQSLSRLISDNRLENVFFTDQEVNGWLAYIKAIFYEYPQVESVYYSIEEDNIDIWLIIPERDFSLVRRLVDSEMLVLDTFEMDDKSLCQCEFHIIYRDGHLESDLVPQSALRIPK